MFKKTKFYILGTLLCCLVTALYYTLKSKQMPYTTHNTNHDYIKITNHFLTRIEKLWRLGDLEGKYQNNKLNCPDYIVFNNYTAKRYLECNPRYIECLFSQMPMKRDGFEFSLDKVVSYRPTKIDFNLKSKQEDFTKTLTIELENHCHQSLLPQQVYTLESLDKKQWSSVGRNIYLDKFLVSQNEVNFWRQEYQKSPVNWGLPALGLSKSDQKSFCESRGKRLMSAHIFEAGTRLHPSSKLSIYPWTHYSANSKEGLSRALINEQLCSRSYMSECVSRYAWVSYQGDSVSWIGIHDVFGGHPERFENIYEPGLSLKKADYTVSVRDTDLAKIGFKKQGSISSKAIGFRCYEERK